MDNLVEKVGIAIDLLWAKKEVRKVVEDAGVKIVPNNFYSSVPSIDEIENSFEYVDDIESSPPYGECDIFGSKDKSRELLQELIRYAKEFNPDVDGDEEEPQGFFWKNSQFGYSDAMSYYALLRHIKPKNIIEIGSGFSTLVAMDAISKNGTGQVKCIEPFPRSFLEESKKVELIKHRAQDVTPEWLNENLEDGDVLFIDSTHTVKTGSDCAHIFLRLLPKIKHNIYIHVHDIFLPFSMPKNWLMDNQIYWTEQYLLLAFLLDNEKASFVFGSEYHYWANKNLLEEFMCGNASPGGSSFWFKYNGKNKNDK